MKKFSKIMNTISGSFLLLRFFEYLAIFVISGMEAGYSGEALLLGRHLIIMIAFLVCGIKAIRRKPQGLAWVTIGFISIIVNRIVVGIPAEVLSFLYEIGVLVHYMSIHNVLEILTGVVFVYLLYKTKGSIFNIKDTTSEVAKKKIQAEKQRTVYDDQLRDGIITKEEYEQLIKNQKK